MKKYIQKNRISLIFTALLVIVICFFAEQTDYHKFWFQMNRGGEYLTVYPYQQESGEYIAFFPSGTRMEDVTLRISAGESVKLDGEKVPDGASCAAMIPEKEYQLFVGGKRNASLRILISENVGSVFVDTRSGTMDYIHEDNAHEESADVRMYTAEGELQLRDKGSSIKGRGNATWDMEKKPYLLTLSKAENLLDMGVGQKWVLLSNAMDESNLHNKIAHDLAAKAGMGWVPQCEYVELYLNGEYSGLYLLAEKVEAGEERLNISTENGDFLCKVDLEERWEKLSNPIRTDLNRTVEITVPKEPVPSEKQRITQQISEMEECITSGKDLTQMPQFDLESWIIRYLIDEAVGNIDADVASSYFYCTDGVFYAGPIWDYDMTFGIHHRGEFPDDFVARNLVKSATIRSRYYAALYENASFYNEMTGLYQTKFRPLLLELVSGGIQETADRIAAASASNSIRWATMFEELHSSMGLNPSDTGSILSYLEKRIGFLDSAWIEGVEYCTVQFELEEGRSYGTASVKAGERLEPENGYLDWYVAGTGERFDPEQPVLEDMVLLLHLPGSAEDDASQSMGTDPANDLSFSTGELLVLAVTGLLICMTCILACVGKFKQK